MKALVNAMPINNASAKLILGKYQIRIKKYPAAAIVLALLTKNAIYRQHGHSPTVGAGSRDKEGYHPGIRAIVDNPPTYLSNGLYNQ